MKKMFMRLVLLYSIVTHFLVLQAQDEYQIQGYLSAWPTAQNYYAPSNIQSNYNQKDAYDFQTPQHSSFLSTSVSQDRYQQHRQFVLSNVVGISLHGKTIKITPEDIDLINLICADNPHKSPDALRMQLSASSAFNYAQHFLKGDNLLHAFTPDIFIDLAHFKSVSESQCRIVKLEKAAKVAIEDRHKREKSQLESTYKEQLKVAKKKSKSEENRVASAHKKKLADLEALHKQEKKHPLGIKQSNTSVAGSLQQQSQTIQQASVQQLAQKSNISLQEIKKLREYNNNQVLKVDRADDSSLQQVMDNRSKAFEMSVKNQTPTTKLIKINSQTIAFLQTQGIDTTQFQQIEGLPIQHQLTHELVDILDAVADYAQQHHYEMYQTHLTKYCVYLASLSQESNMQGALEQAIDGTNCCHGIEHYLSGMVSGVTQAYQQFQAALHYLQPTLEEYALIIEQHALQGIAAVSVLEAIVTAGLITAPTATVAATGVMIGATATVMAPLCLQAMIDTVAFGGACINGNWDKVGADLDNFGKFVSSPETVARMAELAAGAVIPTPNLSCVVEHVLSLRPVITSVQNEAGQTISKLYVMSKDRVQKVYQQSFELLQSQDFLNFNLMYEKILGCHFFDILPKSHPTLAGAFAGLESGVMNSAEQTMMTQLFTQADNAVAGEVIKNEVIHAVYPLVENITQPVSFVQNIVQEEIAQALQKSKKMIGIDLFAPIATSRATELAYLSKNIRQLQDFAKYTNNFQNLNELISQDIAYLNRIYELQSYRAQIKKFLDTHKPYFMHDGQQYFIEDIASYHIHAGDYTRKEKPKGGHSNYNGNKLDCFNLEIIKHGPFGAKDVLFYNARNANLTKPSSIYPEIWSEFVCDLKAIEVMLSDNTVIEIDLDRGIINFEGCTSEGLNIRIGYDIKTKRIKTHYPKFD